MVGANVGVSAARTPVEVALAAVPGGAWPGAHPVRRNPAMTANWNGRIVMA
jgi:hypothetical protein